MRPSEITSTRQRTGIAVVLLAHGAIAGRIGLDCVQEGVGSQGHLLDQAVEFGAAGLVRRACLCGRVELGEEARIHRVDRDGALALPLENCAIVELSEGVGRNKPLKGV